MAKILSLTKKMDENEMYKKLSLLAAGFISTAEDGLFSLALQLALHSDTNNIIKETSEAKFVGEEFVITPELLYETGDKNVRAIVDIMLAAGAAIEILPEPINPFDEENKYYEQTFFHLDDIEEKINEIVKAKD